MDPSANPQAGLSVSALGAGDLIDRAVRFYRKYFWTFILIAAPPVVVGTVISVLWTFTGRQLFSVGDAYSAETAFYYLFVSLGTVVIWLTETIATLVVMGGASRNFVRHLLFGEAITFRETYRNVKSRLGGLVVASSLIAAFLGTIGLAIFYFAFLLIVLAIYAVYSAIGELVPVVTFIIGLLLTIAVSYGAIWLFFLAASRLAYVPQAMLVEGQGAFSAIGRSASLAGNSVRRLAALFIFSTVATYSALAILYVPLAWYASSQGISPMNWDADIIPAWYEISYNLIWQVSFILLSPVWMIGLCLLYVDERVRAEGYDIELMAAARLGDIPNVPSTYINPLQPALAGTQAAPPPQSSSITTLGLK